MDKIKDIGITALKKSYKTHEELGEKGEEIIKKNQFGDEALRADIEIEKSILDFLRDLKLPIRVVSEEHGTTDITENPKYLGILDGVDGSDNYKKGRGKKRYGTMFAILSNLDPTYEDYLFTGVMEHSRNRLFYAIKNKGSFLIENGKEKKIFSSGLKELDKKTKIYIDEHWDVNRKIFSSKLGGFNTKCLSSSSMHYVDLAEGKVDLVLECTRKGNLEIASAFGLINESGGTIIKINGKSIKKERYFEFEQHKHLPIISSATQDLGMALIKKIKS